MCSHLPVSKIWLIITYIWIGTCLSILLVVTMIHMCGIDRQEKKLFRNFILFTIMSYLLCSILDMSYITIHFIECSGFESFIVSIVSGFIASALFYCLLIIKIWFLLKRTIYRMQKMTFFILGLLASLIVFFAVCYILFDHVAATYALVISVFVLNISLFCLFYQKVIKIVSDTDLYVDRPKHDRLLQLIDKHTKLFGIGMIANQCFYIGIILEQYFRSDKNYAKIMLILFNIRALENLCNGLVVWLMLNINTAFYLKICGCCNIQVHSWHNNITNDVNKKVRIISEKSINHTSTNERGGKIRLLTSQS
eukprot:473990_1